MRKVILALVTALCLLSTFTIGASAHTITTSTSAHTILSPHKLHPRESGGGCGNEYTSSGGDISASSCISLDGDTLIGDAYLTFRPLSPYGAVDGCTVQLVIPGYQGVLQQNCTQSAINRATDAHFGTIKTTDWQYGDTAVTVANIKLTYTFGHVSTLNLVKSRQINL